MTAPRETQGAWTPGRGIYVASRASVPERGAMWRWFRDQGFPVISSWIDEDGPGQTPNMAALWERIVREVSSASALVLFVGVDDLPLKGAYVEVGIALGSGIPVHVVCNVPLDAASLRPLGSWAAHPLVTFHSEIRKAMDAALTRAAGENADER